MTDRRQNLPASVARRLLNRAKRAGDDYQTLFANFCFGRFLYRVGASTVRDRFVLKGAMLLRLWGRAALPGYPRSGPAATGRRLI